ncbi:MAG: bifunctional phosphoribosylaminoimidazolecarboxamide formyltransferase/IMP cyclohydrolase [Planctomycetota bacterium]|nr:bifunctional phosphoribosylaminoimidazolecarboxamide formyltransferase/IMP cyclohydrolase [Planctomycetota bacterium]
MSAPSSTPKALRKIERALIAVSDKQGVVELCATLQQLGVEILSTGGTAAVLQAGGITVRPVEAVTGFPEMMGGRVKTLHPRVHGGLLARRDVEGDLESCHEHGIPPIDLLVVNLYPFEQTVAAGASFEETVEQIDIGGPAMVRAAAKNHRDVAVVVDPEKYPALIAELKEQECQLSGSTRVDLALEAFRRTAAYDASISNWLGQQVEGAFPESVTEQWTRVGPLRYGENPHQEAAWYQRNDGDSFSIADATCHGGKALSYNNILDASAAIECCRGLAGPAAVVVKHCLPCGAAERQSSGAAFEAALAGDPVSAFGGILALSEPLDEELAGRIATSELFFEVIHAPKFLPGAIQAIRDGVKWGRSCRMLEGGETGEQDTLPIEIRSVPGAMLLQTRDRNLQQRADFTIASQREPTDQEWQDLLFGWRVLPHVRSNGILLAHHRAVMGVGAGQPSRVDAVEIACRKAGDRCKGSSLASDAFFPFPDGVEAAISSGVTAVIQPGGSIRDGAVIEVADAAGIAMVFTGERHFRH